MDSSNPMIGKLMARAFCCALAAFVFGLSGGHIFIKHLDNLFLAVAVVSGAALVFVLFWTHYTVKRFAVSEAVRKSAQQFLWSCVFFAMISWMFGLQVSGVSWFSTDFLRKFGFVFWGLMTCVAIFPVRRDARRLANAVGSEIASR
jgi:hypothetical protein